MFLSRWRKKKNRSINLNHSRIDDVLSGYHSPAYIVMRSAKRWPGLKRQTLDRDEFKVGEPIRFTVDIGRYPVSFRQAISLGGGNPNRELLGPVKTTFILVQRTTPSLVVAAATVEGLSWTWDGHGLTFISTGRENRLLWPNELEIHAVVEHDDHAYYARDRFFLRVDETEGDAIDYLAHQFTGCSKGRKGR